MNQIKVLLLIKVPSTPLTVAITADDQKIAIGCEDGSVHLFSLRTNHLSTLKGAFEGPVTKVAFYPFKKSILTAVGQDGFVRIWDLNEKIEPLESKKVHDAPITDLAFAPCNKHFYCTVGLDKCLQFHDIQGSGKVLLQSYYADAPLFSVTINDEHTVAMGTTLGRILIYDVRLKTVVHTIQSPEANISSLAFQPPKVIFLI